MDLEHDQPPEEPFWDLRSDDKQTCEIHGTPLTHGHAEIVFGLVRHLDSYWDDRKDLFPNSNSWVMGGCIAEDVAYAVVNFCHQCRDAEVVWEQVRKLLSSFEENLAE